MRRGWTAGPSRRASTRGWRSEEARRRKRRPARSPDPRAHPTTRAGGPRLRRGAQAAWNAVRLRHSTWIAHPITAPLNPFALERGRGGTVGPHWSSRGPLFEQRARDAWRSRGQRRGSSRKLEQARTSPSALSWRLPSLSPHSGTVNRRDAFAVSRRHAFYSIGSNVRRVSLSDETLSTCSGSRWRCVVACCWLAAPATRPASPLAPSMRATVTLDQHMN